MTKGLDGLQLFHVSIAIPDDFFIEFAVFIE